MNKIIATLLLTALLTATAHANIIYTGSHSFDSTTVSLSITTDGAIGSLATGNLLDWSFTLSNGGGTKSLTAPASGGNFLLTYLIGNAFQATATELLFDYSAVGQLQWDNFFSGGRDFICFDTTGAFPSCGRTAPSEYVGVNDFTTSTSRSGPLVLGTATTVPEPATLALMCLGLAGLGLSRRKAKSKSPTSQVVHYTNAASA